MTVNQRLLGERSIVVTGAGRGLGAAYATLAAAHGAHVVVNDIDLDVAEQTAAAIRAQGGVAIANGCDVRDPDAAAALIDAATHEFGRLDGVVNNAGVIEYGPAWDETPQGMRHQVEVNVLGTLYVGLRAMQVMRAAGNGVILNVCSGAATGMVDRATYCATKGAVASVTYAWAIDLQGQGIRVNAIAPVAETRMYATCGVPPGVGPHPSQIAPLVVFLLSDRAAGIHGQVIRLTGPNLGVLSRATNVGQIVRAGGWSIDEIEAAVSDELRPHLIEPT